MVVVVTVDEEEALIGEVSLGRWRERREAMRVELLLLSLTQNHKGLILNLSYDTWIVLFSLSQVSPPHF